MGIQLCTASRQDIDQHTLNVDALRRMLARDYAEPMTKEDIRHRRLEGEDMHLVETNQLLRATINHHLQRNIYRKPMYFRGVRLQWDEEIG